MMATDKDQQPPNRGGRPRSPEPTVPASTRLPVSEYDRLARLALKEDRSLSSLIADLLKVSGR